ncbi:TPA: hypothetical protein DCZ39_01165 [Patescibacteria group bacterium]|nr:hypothetical protein [Candidatus Gracilibacteria bacterium]
MKKIKIILILSIATMLASCISTHETIQMEKTEVTQFQPHQKWYKRYAAYCKNDLHTSDEDTIESKEIWEQ